MFAADGFARTTLAKIAAAAGVSPETVQGHGPKAALFIAAIENAAFGSPGEVSILDLEVGRRISEIDDYAEALDFIVEAQAGVHERTATLTQALFNAAGSDPELDRYKAAFQADVDSQFRRILGVYRDRGWLRTDVSFDEIVQTCLVLGGIEPYLKLVHGQGWSIAAYKAWSRRVFEETNLVAPERTNSN